MRATGREILRLGGVAVIVGGLAAALALLFVPLGVQRVSGAVVGFCGPGLTSDNAIQVRLDPGVVNTGGSPGQLVPAAEQRQLERFCTREANTRLVQALATAVVALLAGVPLFVFGGQDSGSGPGEPSGSEPVSSSGTAGSTV